MTELNIELDFTPIKLTKKQRGLLETLIHNIVQSENWQFKIMEILDEQKKSLGINFPLKWIEMELKIKIYDKQKSTVTRWQI